MSAESARRLLVVMAHPDDAEILVGGILLHLKSLGWDLGVVTMTAGDCGSATHTKGEIVQIRAKEAQAAAAQLGAWHSCLGLMDIEVFANGENVRKVVETLRVFGPDVVITHSPTDYMLDHEETARLVRAATFAMAMPLFDTRHAAPAAAGRTTPALYYADSVEGVDLEGRRIYPHFYVNVSEQLAAKRALLSCHASQRHWLREHHGVDEYLERMASWAAKFGSECGFDYAEGLRQHLGHGYPHAPLLQTALKPFVKKGRIYAKGSLD